MTDPYDRFDERHSQYEDEPTYDCGHCLDTGFMHGLIGSMDYHLENGCRHCGITAVLVQEEDEYGILDKVWRTVPTWKAKVHKLARLIKPELRPAA